MSRSEPTDEARLLALPQLPLGPDGPVFDEPWQATAFALTLQLHARGAFTWTEWAAALSDELKRAESDDGSRYYEHWLTALEGLVTSQGLADSQALGECKAAWAEAYRHTPHGQPVRLPADR